MDDSDIDELDATTSTTSFFRLNIIPNVTTTDVTLNNSFFNDTSDGFFDEYDDNFLPDWLIVSYFCFIIIGSVVDIVYVIALLRCKRSGTFSLLLQLTTVDAVSPMLAAIEILTIRNKTWIFSHNLCPFYSGSEILLNSLDIWIIICINFHVISLWNLLKSESENKTRNPLMSCDDESNECLVTKRESARVINIDYRRRKEDISVMIPSILIWFWCISLSIPSFTLSSALKLKQEYVVCALVDNYYAGMFQILSLVFRVLLPVPLLLFSLFFLILKLSKTSLKDVKHILTKDFAELRELLIFCICLTVLYLCTSFQRNLFHFLHVRSNGFYSDDAPGNFQVPPLYNNRLTVSNNTSLTMLHYSCNTVRSVLILYLLPKFKKLIKHKVLVCYTK